MHILRINKKSGEVINDYEIRDDEKVVIENNRVLVLTENEYEKYSNEEIEDYELDDAPYELESDEIFLVKQQ